MRIYLSLKMYVIFVENNIENLVFASSATVYGEPDIFPTPENYTSRQTSLYGASKISCEAFIQAYSNYGYFKSTILDLYLGSDMVILTG